MAHTYATLAEFNDYLRDTGSTTFAAESALIIARKLATLEAVSRRIDDHCSRSQFGSDFGPRLGTNSYDGESETRLYLGDDLLSYTSGTVKGQTGGTGVSIAETTDFYLEPSSRTQKRWLRLHGLTSVTVGSGYRIWSIVGKWGYEDRRVSLTTLGAAISSTTATTITLSAAGSPGMTLLIDSEQLYMTAGTTTATVTRGVNGTTAATHSNGATVERYLYDSRAHDVCLRLAQRRWRGRDAGADGSDGGGDVGVTIPREGEDLILRRGLARLKVWGTG